MVSVKWTENALHNLDELDAIIRERILHKVSWLEANFERVMPERLHMDLSDFYKLRVGDYRVVYTISRSKIITVEAVGHRRDIYRH